MVMCNSLYQKLLLLSQNLEEEEDLHSWVNWTAKLIPAEWRSFRSFLKLVSLKTQVFGDSYFWVVHPIFFDPYHILGVKPFALSHQLWLCNRLPEQQAYFCEIHTLNFLSFWHLLLFGVFFGPFWWQVTDIGIVTAVPVSNGEATQHRSRRRQSPNWREE